jgi:hypothetical protein
LKQKCPIVEPVVLADGHALFSGLICPKIKGKVAY